MRRSLLCLALTLVMTCGAVPQGIDITIDMDALQCELNRNCEDTATQPAPEPVTSETPARDGCTCVAMALCKNSTTDQFGKGIIDIRMMDAQCNSYLQKCCRPEDIMTKPATPSNEIPKGRADICGTRNPNGLGFRITGNNDNEAQYAEFPWMAAVMRTISVNGRNGTKFICGGSFIHPQVVLTAAHCVKGMNNLLVRAGEWDTQTKNELFPAQDINVREIISHEGFNNRSLINDPALLLLSQPVDMSKGNAGLVCLPEADENMDDRNCVTSGWGKHLYGKEGQYQVILKRIDLQMVPRAQCLGTLRKTRLGGRFTLHKSFVCAGGKPGKDACQGDGGGPLACQSKNNPDVYVQAGIVAWGIGCGSENPGVYVNVPHFVDWIKNKLASWRL